MPKYYEQERKREAKDGGMLHEDHSAVANMPQQVKYQPWPDGHDYLDGSLDDTIRGVDQLTNENVNKAKKHIKNTKW